MFNAPQRSIIKIKCNIQKSCVFLNPLHKCNYISYSLSESAEKSNRAVALKLWELHSATQEMYTIKKQFYIMSGYYCAACVFKMLGIFTHLQRADKETKGAGILILMKMWH